MEETRICSKCLISLPLNAFQKDAILSDRKNPKKFYMCSKCRYEYHQKYNKKKNRVRYSQLEVERRVRYKNEAIRLLGGCCFDCKVVYPSPVYDFHHLDPSQKEYYPAATFQKSWETVEKEIINKCILLCANCHRIRHFVNSDETSLGEAEGQKASASDS